MVGHLLTLKEYSGNWIEEVIEKSINIKLNSGKYDNILKNT